MQVTAKLLKLCLIVCLMKIQVIKIKTLQIPGVYCDLVQVQTWEPHGVYSVWLAQPHKMMEEVLTWLVHMVSWQLMVQAGVSSSSILLLSSCVLCLRDKVELVKILLAMKLLKMCPSRWIDNIRLLNIFLIPSYILLSSDESCQAIRINKQE